MAWGLDTDTFLNAFTRFTSRRGVPKEVISDRGTNFIGAVGELKKLVSQLDRQKLESKTAELGVTWRFNPPGAPHFGGCGRRGTDHSVCRGGVSSQFPVVDLSELGSTRQCPVDP